MSALIQLVDMGIPKARARAALKRTKDDVMSAAVSSGWRSDNLRAWQLILPQERIFAGEFDDVPSDDDNDDLDGDVGDFVSCSAGVEADGRLKGLDQGSKWKMGTLTMVTKAWKMIQILGCKIMVWRFLKHADGTTDQ
jgi:hypothetical protein